MPIAGDDVVVSSRTSRRAVVGWSSLVLGVILIVILGLTPAPYVIEAPGPVFDTLGVDAPVQHSSHAGVSVPRDPQPVINVSGHPTYPTSGGLYMLTVSSYGRPGSLPSWMNVVGAWFERNDAVIPVDAVYPPDTTVATQDKVNTALMAGSQEDAIAAALHHLRIPFTQRVIVRQVLPDTPASSVLHDGDEITAVSGTAVNTVTGLQKALAAHGPSPAKLAIVRSGSPRTVTLTPRRQGDAVTIGVGVTADYSFPFQVSIRLHRVGGPSAGMMFALGIIDKLTPGALTGGQRFAGTGTIEAGGAVGPIGGIVQKMAAAKSAGAKYFLAPRGNCRDVRGHVPHGLHVFSVSNLDNALTVLGAVRTGATTTGLPTCAARP